MLDWPIEAATVPANDEARWRHAGSNVSLDFHGDPVTAHLVVYSDGNHHMALEQCLRVFVTANPVVRDIFYATTPPAVLVEALNKGQLHLGNLCLSRRPQVFIGPRSILDRLASGELITEQRPFMRSRGNVLLVRGGNPRGITGIADLLRPDVRLFMSNPITEKASWEVYTQTIYNLSKQEGVDRDSLETLLSPQSRRTLFGEEIHHREAPQALVDERADVALVYYHLALRYVRIFPQLFEYLSLGEAPDAPERQGNVCTEYSLGLVRGADEWGPRLISFLSSAEATDIYRHHGLLRP